jgi:hypothetical protein
MEYFAGLDVSMAETHVCVVTRNGAVIHQAKVPSTPADIAAELAQVPTCRRILGGFKRLSQHHDEGGCDDHSKAAVGSIWEGAIAVPRSTASGRTR